VPGLIVPCTFVVLVDIGGGGVELTTREVPVEGGGVELSTWEAPVEGSGAARTPAVTKPSVGVGAAVEVSRREAAAGVNT